MTRTQKEKMLAGEMYNAADPEIQADLLAAGAWLKRYNSTLGDSAEQWHLFLREGLGEVGPGAVIRPPFHCDYGFNISIGAHAYMNFNCVILDVAKVTIGDGTALGPLCRSIPPIIRMTPSSGRRGCSSGDLSALASTCGLAVARSSSRA